MKYLRTLEESTGLVPTHISSINNTPYVHWIEGNLDEFIEPFSSQTINRVYKDTNRKRALSQLNIFIEPSDKIQRGCIKGIIFHVSRCGSTLLSNCIRQGTDSVVLSEFQLISYFFNSVGFLLRGKNECDSVKSSILKGILSWLCKITSKDIVIKTNSWNIMQSEFLLEAANFPKSLFIYRNPIEVIASQLENPAPWVNNYFYKKKSVVDVSEDEKKLYRVELMSNVFSKLYKEGLIFLDRGNFFLLDYSNLNNKKIVRIFDFLGLKKDANMDDKLDFCFKFYSKDKVLQKIFLNDSKQKLNVFNKAEINVIERTIYPYYSILIK